MLRADPLQAPDPQGLWVLQAPTTASLLTWGPGVPTVICAKAPWPVAVPSALCPASSSLTKVFSLITQTWHWAPLAETLGASVCRSSTQA